MYYWNQTNFEGLQRIAEYYQEHPDFKLFAAYCYYREKGLRKIALEKIQAFIQHCQTASMAQQLHIALQLLNLIAQHPNIHQLMSQPLQQYLLNLMQQAIQQYPHTACYYQWLGYLTHDLALYQKAYALDPQNQNCLEKIIQFYIQQIDWQTHHLCESFFIGELKHCLDKLQQLKQYIAQFSQQSDRRYYQQQYQYYQALITAWQHYQHLDLNCSFPTWCEQQQLHFNYDQALYYSRP
ncbi:hypothetical protein [Acinetobacter larvae]|uniref:DUF4034 domain-containing protein n=1 Tax=Acinetobacter larvae TaxID=1789224 RepID=A0A1B2LWJ8_9GAMM|nr:hypothetical protein [Acinetobacter larvae]AOA57332.1 hypothetical protein BFG52_02475 [Acinetobacter larvae]